MTLRKANGAGLALSRLSEIGAPHLLGRKQITDANRVHRDKAQDPARIHAAELKRARKASKRIENACPHVGIIRNGACVDCGYVIYKPVSL